MDDTISRDIVHEFIAEPCTRSNGDTNSILTTVSIEIRPRITIRNILDDGMLSVDAFGAVIRIFVGKTSENSVIIDRCSRIIPQPRFVVNHVDTAK